jgi:hypothetical protein
MKKKTHETLWRIESSLASPSRLKSTNHLAIDKPDLINNKTFSEKFKTTTHSRISSQHKKGT